MSSDLLFCCIYFDVWCITCYPKQEETLEVYTRVIELTADVFLTLYSHVWAHPIVRERTTIIILLLITVLSTCHRWCIQGSSFENHLFVVLKEPRHQFAHRLSNYLCHSRSRGFFLGVTLNICYSVKDPNDQLQKIFCVYQLRKPRSRQF